VSKSINQKIKYKTTDRSYPPRPAEQDLSPSAYDAKDLWDHKKPVPANIVCRHDGSGQLPPTNEHDGSAPVSPPSTRGRDIATGRVSSDREGER
jgi:hypothetical protein